MNKSKYSDNFISIFLYHFVPSAFFSLFLQKMNCESAEFALQINGRIIARGVFLGRVHIHDDAFALKPGHGARDGIGCHGDMAVRAQSLALVDLNAFAGEV